MAITVSYAPIICECDGSNRTFSVTWPFFEPADLRVTWINAAGTETALPLGKGFAGRGGKDGLGCPGVGIVETVGIYAAGDRVRIERETPITQVEALTETGPHGKRVERALDRAMMVLEELAYGRTLDRVIKVSANGSAPVEVKRDVPTTNVADLESLVRGLIKAQADQVQASLRTVGQSIEGVNKRVDAMRQPVEPVSNIPSVPAERNPATLDEARRAAYAALNDAASKVRALIATPGKELVYIQKQNEARAAIDDVAPSAPQAHPETGVALPGYPHLEGMIGLWVASTGDLEADIRSAAIFVLGRAADFKVISARIEKTLDLAKQRIATATTIADVMSVPPTTSWDLQ